MLHQRVNLLLLEGLSADDSLVTGPYRTLKKLKDGEAVRKKDEGKKEGDGEGDEESEGEEGDSGVEVEVD